MDLKIKSSIMSINDLLMDKIVPCPVRYRQGYGKYAYLHECMSCSLCTKYRILNEITIFFIYVNVTLKIFLHAINKKIVDALKEISMK